MTAINQYGTLPAGPRFELPGFPDFEHQSLQCLTLIYSKLYVHTCSYIDNVVYLSLWL